MHRSLLISALFLVSCSQEASHTAIQDAYGACGNFNGVNKIVVNTDMINVVCNNGHWYGVPKYQRRQVVKETE